MVCSLLEAKPGSPGDLLVVEFELIYFTMTNDGMGAWSAQWEAHGAQMR